MCGSYIVHVQSKRVCYHIRINRNITMITGDSATGKTVLCDLITAYLAHTGTVKVWVESVETSKSVNVPCITLTTTLWLYRPKIDNSIVFVDESMPFVTTSEFAKYVKESSSYFVIINRHYKTLDQLPYSVEEIYELKSEKRIVENVKKITYTYNSKLGM